MLFRIWQGLRSFEAMRAAISLLLPEDFKSKLFLYFYYMKVSLIFLMLFCSAAKIVYGQAQSLEFSRVLLFNSDSGSVTVPSGKVWKVIAVIDETKPYRSSVSVSYPRGNASTPDACNGCANSSCNNREMRSYSWSDCSSRYAAVFINGQEAAVENYQSTSLVRLKAPLWLKAGDSLQVGHSAPCYSIPVVQQPSGSCGNCGTIFNENYNDCTPDVRQCGTSAIPGAVVRVSRWVNVLEFDATANPQSSLNFVQVHTFSASDGIQTVPANRQWKLAKIMGNSQIQQVQSHSTQTIQASPAQPNPCTGDTTGSYTRWDLQMGSCCNGSGIKLNGTRLRYRDQVYFEDYNLWLSAGNSIELEGSSCTHNSGVSIPAQGVYYLNNNQMRCGPAQFTGTASFSPLLSVLEFEKQ